MVVARLDTSVGADTEAVAEKYKKVIYGCRSNCNSLLLLMIKIFLNFSLKVVRVRVHSNDLMSEA